MIGCAPMVGEEQQTEPDLGDEERLRERQQMRRQRPRTASAPVDETAPERRQRADGDDCNGNRLVGG